MNGLDLLNLVVAHYKDKAEAESLQKLKNEISALIEAEAETRREKAASIIIKKAKLEISLQKFQATYNMLKTKCGEIKALDDYILEVKSEIARLSYKKNNHQI